VTPLRLRVRQLLTRTAIPRPPDSQCAAVTRAGSRCRLPAHAGPYCALHTTTTPPRAA